MNGFEINKIFGATTGTLAVFLAIQIVADGVFGHGGHHGEEQQLAYAIEVQGQEPEQQEEATPLPVLLAAADAGAGERVFSRCSACHAIEQGGANGAGPALYGIVGRDIASVDGFSYSGALTGLEGDWTFEELDGFLEDPQTYAPGTGMRIKLDDPEQRADLLLYLNAQSGAPLPLPDVPEEETEPDEAAALEDGSDEAGEAPNE